MLGVTEAAPCPRTDQPRLYQVASLRRDSYRYAPFGLLPAALAVAVPGAKGNPHSRVQGGAAGGANSYSQCNNISYIVCGERSLIL